MLIEFSSARPPGPPPLSDGRRQRSYWPGGLLCAAGLILNLAGNALDLPGNALVTFAGWVLGLAGGSLIASAVIARRHHATREPRHWTINDQELRAANALGSVRWAWVQVRRVVERPEVYLLYQSDSPHTATFDVPRDVLTPAQDEEFRAFLAERGIRPSAT